MGSFTSSVDCENSAEIEKISCAQTLAAVESAGAWLAAVRLHCMARAWHDVLRLTEEHAADAYDPRCLCSALKAVRQYTLQITL